MPRSPRIAAHRRAPVTGSIRRLSDPSRDPVAAEGIDLGPMLIQSFEPIFQNPGRSWRVTIHEGGREPAKGKGQTNEKDPAGRGACGPGGPWRDERRGSVVHGV